MNVKDVRCIDNCNQLLNKKFLVFFYLAPYLYNDIIFSYCNNSHYHC